MQWVREYTPDLERHRLFRRALFITLGGNLLLTAGKGTAAYLSHSVALYADAANSASDLFYSLLMALALWMAQQPPDLTHPQGHSRFEPLAGLIIAAAMTFAGYEAGRASVLRFLKGGLAVEPGWPMLALLVSAAIKGGMYGIIRRIAHRVHSPTLSAAAQDNLSDVLTSVAALAGTIGSAYLHPLADPIAGFLVSLWIFRAAYEAWRENLRYLTGGGASSDVLQQIAEVAAAIPGVERVHQVIAAYAGPRLVADLHVDVDGSMTLTEAHRISDQVQEALEQLPEVDRAYVHVEPLPSEAPEAPQDGR